MPVKEEDMLKATIRVGSPGLYKYTWVPFGLPNSGSSFCHLVQMCLGEQQFILL